MYLGVFKLVSLVCDILTNMFDVLIIIVNGIICELQQDQGRVFGEPPLSRGK